MADEGQGGCFQGLNGDHDEAPADRVEHAPRGAVVLAEGDDPADQPQVQGVSDRGLGEGVDGWAGQDLEGSDPGSHPVVGVFAGPAVHSRRDVDEVEEPGDGGTHVAGEPDERLVVDRRRPGSDAELGDD